MYTHTHTHTRTHTHTHTHTHTSREPHRRGRLEQRAYSGVAQFSRQLPRSPTTVFVEEGKRLYILRHTLAGNAVFADQKGCVREIAPEIDAVHQLSAPVDLRKTMREIKRVSHGPSYMHRTPIRLLVTF